jgi:hypothetical protein
LYSPQVIVTAVGKGHFLYSRYVVADKYSQGYDALAAEDNTVATAFPPPHAAAVAATLLIWS